MEDKYTNYEKWKQLVVLQYNIQYYYILMVVTYCYLKREN